MTDRYDMPPEDRTPMTQQTTAPQFPPGRYGRRREARNTPRWLVAVLLAVVIAAGLAISVQLYRQYGNPEYQPKVLTFQIGEGKVTIRFQVYKPGGKAATCIVRARAENGEEVGRAEVAVPAGAPDSNSVTVTYTLATSREPVTGEVVGCAPSGA